MTLKKMFDKLEAYNEIAGIMGAPKAKLFLYETLDVYSRHRANETGFTDYDSFCKWFRNYFVLPLADEFLMLDTFEFGKEVQCVWNPGCGFTPETERFTVEIYAQ